MPGTAVIAAHVADFVSGLILGTLLGLLLAPRVWSWLAWREWRDASREADRERRLNEELLERMEADPLEPDGRGSRRE